LFCGDALGAYFSDIKGRLPSCILGSDPTLILQSIDKQRELNPEIILFSHGGATREVAEIVQRVANDEQQCADIALKALKAGEDREEMAKSLVGVLVKDSTMPKEDFLTSSPYFYH
jgi:glyoxylase-like metal-dependent hydrolase (beta-lactamase superfamily II)